MQGGAIRSFINDAGNIMQEATAKMVFIGSVTNSNCQILL